MVLELLERYQSIHQLRLLLLFMGVALVISSKTYPETLLQWEGFLSLPHPFQNLLLKLDRPYTPFYKLTFLSPLKVTYFPST